MTKRDRDRGEFHFIVSPSAEFPVDLSDEDLKLLVAMVPSTFGNWWADEIPVPPTIRLGEVAPVTLLLVACLVLTFAVEGPFGFIQRTAAQLLSSTQYVEAVLPLFWR